MVPNPALLTYIYANAAAWRLEKEKQSEDEIQSKLAYSALQSQ